MTNVALVFTACRFTQNNFVPFYLKRKALPFCYMDALVPYQSVKHVLQKTEWAVSRHRSILVTGNLTILYNNNRKAKRGRCVSMMLDMSLITVPRILLGLNCNNLQKPFTHISSKRSEKCYTFDSLNMLLPILYFRRSFHLFFLYILSFVISKSCIVFVKWWFDTCLLQNANVI